MNYKTVLFVFLNLILSSACGQAPVIQPEQELAKSATTVVSLANSPVSTPVVNQFNSPLVSPAKVEPTATPTTTTLPKTLPSPTATPTVTPTIWPIRKDGTVDYPKLIDMNTTHSTYYDEGHLVRFRIRQEVFEQPVSKIIYLEREGTERRTNNLWIADVQDVSQKELIFSLDVGYGSSISHITLSPNKKLIAYDLPTFIKTDNRYQSELWLIDIDGQNKRLLEAKMFHRILGGESYFWSPDSQFLLYSTLDGKTYKINVHTEERTLLFDPKIGTEIREVRADLALLGWSPQNTEVYLAWEAPDNSDNWDVYAIDPETTHIYSMGSFDSQYFYGGEISPDGQIIFFSATNCPLFNLDPLQHQNELIIAQHGCGPFQWIPGSNSVLSSGQIVINFNFLYPTTNWVTKENSIERAFMFPSESKIKGWSPNGRYIVYTKKTMIDDKHVSAEYLLDLAIQEEQMLPKDTLEIAGWLNE